MIAREEPRRFDVLVHEVRSPVAALRAIAHALGGDDVDPSELRRLAELAVAACRSIDRLVGDVAIASVRHEDVDPGRLVVDAAAAAEILGARVRTLVADDLPLLRADPLRLRQALDNLVANALAHSQSGEVVVAGAVDRGAVVLSVGDSGRGIRAEDQARIFEPGMRLDPGVPGSGLGLSITRAIAEAHGGTLTVDSVPGQGTIFAIAIPVA
jgi:two-component system sensor histidine kinase BaeS